MQFNPQLFKVSIIQTKLFGPLDFELSRFHCICLIFVMTLEYYDYLWIQTKLFGPLDFELSRFHCICLIFAMTLEYYDYEHSLSCDRIQLTISQTMIGENLVSPGWSIKSKV